MNNYLIMGIVFILVLGMLQLISINIRLRTDIKKLNKEVDFLDDGLSEYSDKYIKLEEQYYLATKK